MPRNTATVVDNNFSKGLITEATGLNFPENSCVETYDCEFDFFGRVSRRYGFEIETSFIGNLTSRTGVAVTYHHWRNITGDGTVSLVVLQIGGTLHFYQTNEVSLSLGQLASTISLSTYSPPGAPAASLYDCQYADSQGKLFVFHPFLGNFYVTYDSSTEVVTGTAYDLKVRDFEGAVADPYDIDERPTATVGTVDTNHLYNLYNQGWAKADLTTPELTAWDTAVTTIPSNCDVWWTFKNATEQFDTTWIDRNGRGSTPAPKGHFILEAYDMDRATASGIGGIASTTSGTARSSCGTFHAGRVFYAGINSAGYTGKIFYTQILERDTQVGDCYQQNDPTSEDLFDLLPADGGVISIPEAGTVYKLVSIANGLLVFAYRGVWYVTGSQGIGFSAVDYTVSKISSVRTVSGTSFVDVNGTPMWWNTDGIFTIAISQQGAPVVQSMTLDTIQTFYDDIPALSKAAARGSFNPLTQVVQWVYATESPDTVEEQHTYNAVLNYNIYTKAFYPWTIGENNDVHVHGVLVVDSVGGLTQSTLVVDNSAVQVVNNLGENVVAYQLSQQGVEPTTKYVMSADFAGDNYFSFAETHQLGYQDWGFFDGVDYDSYFITGYKIHGQGMMKFTPMYVTVYGEDGTAYIRGVWDFALNGNTGRFSTQQELDFTDTNYGTIAKRLKIRGQGRTLQYKVSSALNQPFTISGWSAFETGNTRP